MGQTSAMPPRGQKELKDNGPEKKEKA